MLRIASLLLGYNYAVVKKQTIASRQKITKLGMLLTLPVFIWAASTFLLSYKLLELSFIISCFVALVCAAIIYFLDRTFVTSDGDGNMKKMRNIRVILAVISALIGSIALDLSIFENDIDAYQSNLQVESQKAAKIEYLTEFKSEIQRNEELENTMREKADELQIKYQNEMQGDGTGQSGYGPIAKKLEQDANEAKMEFERTKAKNDIYMDELEKEAEVFAVSSTSKNQNAIMDKVKDFHHYVFSDWYSGIIYVLFMLLLFIVETMLLTYKAKAATTSFEKMLVEQEKIHESELTSFRQMKEKYLDSCAVLGSQHYNDVTAQSNKSLRRIV